MTIKPTWPNIYIYTNQRHKFKINIRCTLGAEQEYFYGIFRILLFFRIEYSHFLLDQNWIFSPHFQPSTFSNLLIFNTPHFQPSTFSTLLIFNTPHYQHSSFSTLRIINTPRFQHSSISTLHISTLRTPHSGTLALRITLFYNCLGAIAEIFFLIKVF